MKRLNQKGIGHHLMVIGMAVLVIGAIGFGGYRVYKARNIDAKADSWRTVKTFNQGGLISRPKAYVYPTFKSPQQGTYRVCARVSSSTTVSSSTSSATLMVSGGPNDSPRTKVGKSKRTLCTSAKPMNSGQNIIPAVYSYDNYAEVSSAYIQIYGM